MRNPSLAVPQPLSSATQPSPAYQYTSYNPPFPRATSPRLWFLFFSLHYTTLRLFNFSNASTHQSQWPPAAALARESRATRSPRSSLSCRREAMLRVKRSEFYPYFSYHDCCGRVANAIERRVLVHLRPIAFALSRKIIQTHLRPSRP